MKLKVKAFALTCGILWAIGLFGLTWWLIADGELADEKTIIGHIYLGYRVSPAGSLIGLVWAFADGLICGAIFAWLYNVIATRTPCSKKE